MPQELVFLDLLVRRTATWIRCRGLQAQQPLHGSADDLQAYQAKYLRTRSALSELEEALAGVEASAAQPPLLRRLATDAGLDSFEQEVLALAVALAVDSGLSSELRRVTAAGEHYSLTPAVCTALFLPEGPQRLARLASFVPAAPLLAAGLLQIVSGAYHHPGEVELRLQPTVLRRLLGHTGLSPALGGFARLRTPGPELGLEHLVLPSVTALQVQALAASRSPWVGLITGAPGGGKSRLAAGLAVAQGRSLIELPGRPAFEERGDPAELLAALLADATSLGALLVFDRCRPLLEDPRLSLPLWELLDAGPGVPVLFVADEGAALPEPLLWRVQHHLQLRAPSFDDRILLWQNHLTAAGLQPPSADALGPLSSHFELGPGQIANAVRVAVAAGPLDPAAAEEGPASAPAPVPLGPSDGAAPPPPMLISVDALKRAAATQLRADVTELQDFSGVHLSLKDLVLPDPEMDHVRELLAACRNHHRLLSEWGFGKRLLGGRGIVAMLWGPPGTGKSYTARILASELRRPLLEVSIPRLVSKWVGETEKNISEVFGRARAAQALLLFDEADSLFGSRGEVRTASDRYANLETNHMLMELERFDGIVLLTTNLKENIDEAFMRRILFQIPFPFPDVEERTQLWDLIIPAEAPLGPEFDPGVLAETFEITGGHIKNAVLRAAYRAIEQGTDLSMLLLGQAAAQEAVASERLVRWDADEWEEQWADAAAWEEGEDPDDED